MNNFEISYKPSRKAFTPELIDWLHNPETELENHSFYFNEFMTREDIDRLLMRAHSFSRFKIFQHMVPYIKGEDYWYALREAFSGSDNLYSFRAAMKNYFGSLEYGRHLLMDEKERRFLDKLPDIVTIYRGMTKEEFAEGNFGISWTIKKSVADFFAYQYWRNTDTRHLEKVVARTRISKSDIISFFNDRKEYEIICLNATNCKLSKRRLLYPNKNPEVLSGRTT